jgi:hypothetical protein
LSTAHAAHGSTIEDAMMGHFAARKESAKNDEKDKDGMEFEDEKANTKTSDDKFGKLYNK